MIEKIVPENDKHWHQLRSLDVTSTEVAALFGLSPYMTEFELWHRHRDASVVSIDQTERMVWGNRLQEVIAIGICVDNNWSHRRMPEYMRDPDLKMGASFDFEIKTQQGVGLLETKNVDSLAFRDGWIETDSGIEAPPHIELQVQQQLAVSGMPFDYIGALVGGNKVALIRREPDSAVIDKIKTKIAAHWESIKRDIPPAPDFSRDADFIGKLYGYAEKDRLFDARGDNAIAELAKEYRSYGDDIKAIEEKRAEIKAALLVTMGAAEKLIGDGFSISASMTEPTIVQTYERKGFRNFRCNFKKVPNV